RILRQRSRPFPIVEEFSGTGVPILYFAIAGFFGIQICSDNVVRTAIYQPPLKFGVDDIVGGRYDRTKIADVPQIVPIRPKGLNVCHGRLSVYAVTDSGYFTRSYLVVTGRH